jgi:hypothetical protein
MEQGAAMVCIECMSDVGQFFYSVLNSDFFYVSWVLFDFDYAEQARDGEGYLNGIVGTLEFIAPEAKHDFF